MPIPRPQLRSAAGAPPLVHLLGGTALGLPGATLPAFTSSEHREKGGARSLTADLCVPRANGEALVGVSPLDEGRAGGSVENTGAPVAQPPSLFLLIALYLLSLQSGDTQDLCGVVTQRLSKSRLIRGARQGEM